MLLPRVDAPITPGKIGLGPYETMDVTSTTNQLKRSMRQMRGFDAYLLTIPGSEPKADFLAAFGGLSKDDAAYETKLSAALDDLLKTVIESCDVNGYSDEDQRILKVIAARSFKLVLAEAMQVFVEDAALQLAEIRANAA